MEEITNIPQAEQSCKTWSYSEKTKRHTTHHTISITKERFTHEAYIKEPTQLMRQRTDLSLKEVNSVSSYFGISRDIKGTITMAVIATLAFIAALINFFKSDDNVGLGFTLLIVAAVFVFLACLRYIKIKPSFILEIETVIHNGTLKQTGLSYGAGSIDFGKKKHSFLFYIVLVILWPVGIIYLLTHSKSSKYRFEMNEMVGNEIVDTIGALLIEK